MKKIVLTLAVIMASVLSTNAQVWMGGSVEVLANKTTTFLEIAPEIGYAIPSSRWTIAAGLDMAFVGNNYTVMFEPYLRYNVCDIEKFSMFLDIVGDFSVGDFFSGFRVGVQPGVAWKATKHWTAAFRFAFLGYNNSDYYTNLGYIEGLNIKFATAANLFGLYYNF